jgi:hypothetical protein
LISGWLFRHWAGVAKRAEAKRTKARAVIEQVMSFLISSDWVIGEAQALKVQVSDVEVRRSFNLIRREQFPKEAEFTAFLRSTGQTIADLLFRVRVDLDSVRIQRQIIAGSHEGTDFGAKWRAQTYCSRAYAVPDCGHVQTPL